jgi:hypothetical protein
LERSRLAVATANQATRTVGAAAASFDLHLPDLSAMQRNSRGKRLAEHYLGLWERDEGSGLAILLRAAATNDGAADRMRDTCANRHSDRRCRCSIAGWGQRQHSIDVADACH